MKLERLLPWAVFVLAIVGWEATVRIAQVPH